MTSELVAVLRESLLALGQAGHPVDANRLAARAWSIVRVHDPEQAATINRTMHVLARLEAEQAAVPTAAEPPTSVHDHRPARTSP